jgi:hypothetical protein
MDKDKQYILEEIKRTAKANGGKPLGQARFCAMTGIKEFDWRGKYWENFGDAQQEAGFERNRKQVLEKFVALMREPKRFPTEAALQMKRLSDMAFPNSKAFLRFGKTKHNGSRRFESTAEPEQAMRIYCRFVMLH